RRGARREAAAEKPEAIGRLPLRAAIGPDGLVAGSPLGSGAVSDTHRTVGINPPHCPVLIIPESVEERFALGGRIDDLPHVLEQVVLLPRQQRRAAHLKDLFRPSLLE